MIQPGVISLAVSVCALIKTFMHLQFPRKIIRRKDSDLTFFPVETCDFDINPY